MITNNLVERLTTSIEQNYAPSILLSGGMDSSSILALAVSELGEKPIAITVSLLEKGDDLIWAKKVTKHLGIEWHQEKIDYEQAIEEGLPELVKIDKSFDLGILNDLPYFFAIKQLSHHEIKSGMTGDGGDWLFGGYQFLWNKENVYNEYVKDALPHIEWTSKTIGEELGFSIKQPYLDKNFSEYALNIPFCKKIKRIPHESYGDVAVDILGISYKFDKKGETGKLWGKVMLREAMQGYLPKDILWRPKTDIEFGSGMYNLSPEIEKRMSDNQYKRIQKRTGINFWGGKAQAYLFSLYESQVGTIPLAKDYERECKTCNSGVPVQRSHCKICGSVDIP